MARKTGIFGKLHGLLSPEVAKENAFNENVPEGREAQYRQQREIQRKTERRRMAAEIKKQKPSGPYTAQERNLLVSDYGEDSGG